STGLRRRSSSSPRAMRSSARAAAAFLIDPSSSTRSITHRSASRGTVRRATWPIVVLTSSDVASTAPASSSSSTATSPASCGRRLISSPRALGIAFGGASCSPGSASQYVGRRLPRRRRRSPHSCLPPSTLLDRRAAHGGPLVRNLPQGPHRVTTRLSACAASRAVEQIHYRPLDTPAGAIVGPVRSSRETLDERSDRPPALEAVDHARVHIGGSTHRRCVAEVCGHGPYGARDGSLAGAPGRLLPFRRQGDGGEHRGVPRSEVLGREIAAGRRLDIGVDVLRTHL